MGKLAQQIEQQWRSQLEIECAEQSRTTRESILSWLLGIDVERFESLETHQLEIATSAIAYRYRILKERYLGIAPERAYSNLIKRLGSVVLLRSKISTGVALSRDRHRAVADVLQEVLQELLQSDRYMQQQMTWIAQFTKERRLQNALLFAATEEYCLRPVRNQPLLAYRFVNYLRRSQRGGLTNVPVKDLVRLVSDEVLTEENDNPVNLLDNQAIAEYENNRVIEQQQAARSRVQQEFSDYLTEKLGKDAAQWLELYLQGKSPEEIATAINLDIKKVYRLREKVSYHAVQVFAIKSNSPIVDEWLETSLEENNFGLLPQQWAKLWADLSPNQRQLIEFKKVGQDIDAIALELKLKAHQVISEWGKIYLAAQAMRSQS
ncbi:HetZ-related protein 2 [Synechocystis sp. PCC 7509]|uniref:HetZ-related protein 2 n=1 Tax=Synechocystis sp. PCC 7509 TaxID=927677 RepID=UPI0002ABCFC9|nr:HetZ-related protein 2 [Synechocystis sp. PCC 7509]